MSRQGPKVTLDLSGTNDGLSMWLGHVAGITVDDEDAAKDEGAR